MSSVERCLRMLLVAWMSLVCVVWVTPVAAAFNNSVVLTDTRGDYPLGRHLLILEDPSKTLTIDDVRSPSYASQFVPGTKEVPSFGFSPSAYWVKVDIDRENSRESQWMLEFGYSPMQWVDVYTLGADGTLVTQHGGRGVRYADRPYRHYKHVFELPLTAGQKTTLFVRIDGESSKSIPLRLFRSDVFAQEGAKTLAVLTFYGGITIALLLYNMFIYWAFKDSGYLYYVCFLGFCLVFYFSLNGISDIFLHSGSSALGVRQIPLSMGIAWMFALLFSSRFLDTRKALPRAHRIIRGFILWGVFVCALALVGSYRSSIINATLFVGLGAIVLLVIAVVAVMQGNRPARYFLLAWTILLLGVIVYILRTIGILPTNTFTEFTMVWGSASEAILLSVALASRLRAMKEQQEQAQRRQLQAQHALFSTQREKLEAQRALNAVQQEALEAERKAHDELKATQAHLIQQEKMASLGLLSAGIAHEIKNPINFMKISNQTLEARVTDLQVFITDLLSDETDVTLKEAFTQRFDGLHSQIALIKEGSERVQAIIAGMRSASRRDETGEKQPIDPTEGLRSTVELVKASWKSLVDFDVSGLSGGARVSGHASALNQVFTNLMVNAAQAIEDRLKADPTGPRGTIRIGSRIERDRLLMDFEDNGGGMSEEVRSKLFTPFFTTKDRERGTGLGMGICLGILEEHGGRLLVESTMGKGSVFRVSLPLLQT